MWSGAAALAVLALVATGCRQDLTADPAEPTAGPTAAAAATPTVSPGGDRRLIGRGTVIDEGSGPNLCFSVMQSLPPQCGGGVALADWRWPERGTERRGGTTWGDFAVVGTYDGRRFRVEKTVEPALRRGRPDELPGTPCPEPPGGWRAPNPARATAKDRERAIRLAERRPGHADTWVEALDRSGDPATTVLNFSFTTDLAEAERAIRAVWGGPLCVSRAERSRAELAAVHGELRRTPDLVSSGFQFGHVHLTVIHDDGSLQRELDRRYGAGLVRVGSALKPYAE